MHTPVQVTPSQNIIDIESNHILLCFCTFCTLLKGKKLSLQNVFVLVLQDTELRNLLRELIGVDSNYEVIKLFLDYDPTITSSKYITKYLNSNKRLCF